MQIIIITKDQKNYIPRLVKELNFQLPSIKRLFVIDKDTDDSKSILMTLSESFIEHTEQQGFCAGKCRDLGLDKLGIDDTLFLDGDRVPHGLSINIINQALQYDACLLRIEHDFRNYFAKGFINHPKFKNDRFLNDFFSCGLLLKKEIIQKVRTIQNGRLFNAIFDGFWGCEDGALGDLLIKLNATCCLFPQYCWIEGGFRNTIYNNEEYQIQVKKRCFLIENQKI